MAKSQVLLFMAAWFFRVSPLHATCKEGCKVALLVLVYFKVCSLAGLLCLY
jgi:hypothetical protein